MDLIAAEQAKYDIAWSIDDYKAHSPGLENVERFMSVIGAHTNGATLVDLGCGTGVAGLKFAELGFDVTYVDFVIDQIDPRVPFDHLILAPLWTTVWSAYNEERFDYGFCCDVLEHIPTEYLMLTIERITASCETSWFQVCNNTDNFGAVIGSQLHLTIQPFAWWRDRMKDFGDLVEARDLCGSSLFVVQS